MRLDLDPASPVPLYQQLVDGIRRLVARGALRPGDRLPAVRDLAVELRLNRNTAARAIQALEAEGIVRTRVGQGTFVAVGAAAVAPARDARVDRAIDALLDEAAALGLSPAEITTRLERRLRERRRGAHR